VNWILNKIDQGWMPLPLPPAEDLKRTREILGVLQVRGLISPALERREWSLKRCVS
jgi:hypothetical protein